MNQTGTMFSKNSIEYLSNSFNIDIMSRILLALREKGRINRTNLAGMAGLNYKQCIKYVNLLQLLGWVHIVLDDGHQVIITGEGIEMVERFTTLWQGNYV